MDELAKYQTVLHEHEVVFELGISVFTGELSHSLDSGRLGDSFRYNGYACGKSPGIELVASDKGQQFGVAIPYPQCGGNARNEVRIKDCIEEVLTGLKVLDHLAVLVPELSRVQIQHLYPSC